MVYYRSMYYQCIDAAVTTIQDRFHQQDYSLYSTLEQLLIKATSSGDYVVEKLTTELQLLICIDINRLKQSITFRDIHEQFQSLPVS